MKRPVNLVQVAILCHELNRAYCATLGDTSQKAWEEAAEWQRESALKGVQFAIENPGAPPSAQHEAWLKSKQEDGWVHGPEKDPEKKQHPCMVPYDQLPEEQRMKDVLFRAVVVAMVWGLDAEHSDATAQAVVEDGAERYHVRASNGPGHFVYARFSQEMGGKKVVMGAPGRAVSFTRAEAEEHLKTLQAVFQDAEIVPVPKEPVPKANEEATEAANGSTTEGVPGSGVPG